MSKIARTQEQLSKARARVAKLEAEFAKLRLAALRTVEMSKVGETVTLNASGVIYKAKKPARFNDRWNITKDGKRIATEFFGSIHDVRFAIAQGALN